MRKSLFILFLAALQFCSLSAAEPNVESREVNGGLDFRNLYKMGAKTTYDHWSYQAHVGMNYLPRSKDGYKSGEFGVSRMNPTAGLQVEYTFTQLWGAMFDVTWMNNNQYNYDNNIFGFGLYGNANLTNILAPYRKWEKFGAFANVGMSFPFTIWKNAKTYAPEGQEKDVKDQAKFSRPYFKLGPSVEYNINDAFAVGAYLDALISPFSCISTAGASNAIHPTRNGGRHMWMTGLTFRYKMGEDRNIRNFNIKKQVDYSLDLKDQLTMINKQNRRIDSMANAVENELTTLKAENASLKKNVKEQQDSINSLRERSAVQAKTIYEMTEDESKMVKASLADLRFETGKAIIKKESYPALDNIVKLIDERKEWNVMLSGYTDNAGDPGKNLLLSRDRAAAVKAYFVNKGIDAGRIQSAGYGDKDPIADNSTPTGRARNRRVELELYHRE